jgi:Na+-transporting methylmalonyl-CoA/oxaloacetate decarboxylase gamma subunit
MKGVHLFMSVVDKLSLGLSTTITGMGIVFIVLIVLWGIIVLEHKFFEKSGIGVGKVKKASPETAAPSPSAESFMRGKSGRAEGQAQADGVEDEMAAIILAAVSEDTDIPISRLAIKSMKKIG